MRKWALLLLCLAHAEQAMARRACVDKNGNVDCSKHLKAYKTCARKPQSDEGIANFAAGQNLSYYCQKTCGACSSATGAPNNGDPPCILPLSRPNTRHTHTFDVRGNVSVRLYTMELTA